tara:strand:+ start:4119 stop:4622 length:504 start_codon:yes stop_codon:yes gene_type:complete
MARLQSDILRGYKFTVSIEQGYFKRTAFQKVTGLKSSVEVVEYREGNMADRMEKFAGMMTYDAVTFERGISNDNDFNTWMKEVCLISSTGSSSVPSGGAPDLGDASYRKDITVKLYNKQGQAAKQYVLLDAFPSEYVVGDFDATTNDVVISSLTIQHHGIIEKNLLA